MAKNTKIKTDEISDLNFTAEDALTRVPVAAKKPRAVRNKKIEEKIDKFFDQKTATPEPTAPVSFPDKKDEYPTPIEVAAPVEPVIFLNTVEKKPIFGMLVDKMFLRIGAALLILVLAGAAGYFYYQNKKLTAGESGKDEVSTYITKISKFMSLPEDEQPTMATVADKEKLSGQPFFAKAENGDKVLFYTKSQKAILYRPSQNKIIEATAMAPGVTNETPQASSNEPVKTEEIAVEPSEQVQKTENETVQAETVSEVKQQASVFVENGTSQKGLAKTMAEKISQIQGVTIAGTGNAEGNFEKTLVVDLSGKNAEMASEIAKALDGEVSTLPENETKKDADIQVIIGVK